MILSVVIATATSSCSDKKLESQLNGSWHADMSHATADGDTINGGIDLKMDAATGEATLTVSAPDGAGILPQYELAGSWSAKNGRLTLNLSNKPLQKHIDRIAAIVDSLAQAHPGIDTISTDVALADMTINQRLLSSLTEQKNLIDSKLADPKLKDAEIMALNASIRVINSNLAAIALKVDQAQYARFVKEQGLLDALRKNVGCISTMDISEISDSTLTLGDNQSKITFKRK